FFQAEDGIRDFHVTGVQTCALPIYGRVAGLDVPGADLDGRVAVDLGRAELGHHVGADLDHGDRDGHAVLVEHAGHADLLPDQVRSEERRVGKERSSRVWAVWSGGQE